jgi:hypothetical protein
VGGLGPAGRLAELARFQLRSRHWDATVVGMLVAYLVLGPIFWLVSRGADDYD